MLITTAYVLKTNKTVLVYNYIEVYFFKHSGRHSIYRSKRHTNITICECVIITVVATTTDACDYINSIKISFIANVFLISLK